jgi:hypothetical protein
MATSDRYHLAGNTIGKCGKCIRTDGTNYTFSNFPLIHYSVTLTDVISFKIEKIKSKNC